MLRSILGLVLGAIVTVIVISIIQVVSVVIFTPTGIDWQDQEAVKEFMANVPLGVQLLVLLAYVAGSFAGGAVAAWIARRAPAFHAVLIGVLVLAASISNLRSFEHPFWFAVAAVLIPVPLAYAGSLVPRRPEPKAELV